MKMLSTKEIERIADVKYDTLMKRARQGLITKPEFVSSGRQGACLMWPVSVVYQLDMISVLKKSGYKNTDIGKIVRGEKVI